MQRQRRSAATAPAGGANQPNGGTATASERLLEAALELIAERGYAAMSVDALARTAGVDKSAVYWNFTNKEGVLEAVLGHVTGACVGEVTVTVAQVSAESPVDQLLTSLEAQLFDRKAKLRVLLAILLERAELDPNARRSLRRFYDDASATLARTLKTALPDARGDVDLAADVLLALLQGAYLRALVLGDDVERARLFSGVRRAAHGLLA